MSDPQLLPSARLAAIVEEHDNDDKLKSWMSAQAIVIHQYRGELLDHIAALDQQIAELQKNESRVAPPSPCVAPAGSTAPSSPGAVTAAEWTELIEAAGHGDWAEVEEHGFTCVPSRTVVYERLAAKLAEVEHQLISEREAHRICTDGQQVILDTVNVTAAKLLEVEAELTAERDIRQKERRGLQERVKFTESFESLQLRLAEVEAQRDALQQQLARMRDHESQTSR